MDRRVGHQVTDIADQHQRARLQAGVASVGGGEGDVLGKLAGDGAPTLVEAFLQRAVHQAAPVAIGKNLVLGIDTRNRIFAIHDARHG